jgi:hypothetical protein
MIEVGAVSRELWKMHEALLKMQEALGSLERELAEERRGQHEAMAGLVAATGYQPALPQPDGHP